MPHDPNQSNHNNNTNGLNSNGLPQFENFGQVLRFLRKEYYPAWMSRSNPDLPRVHLTALALTECLGRHGYSISSSAFSALESGATLPRDPHAFLQALLACFPLPSDDTVWTALVRHLGYGLLRRDLGKPWAGYIIPKDATEAAFAPAPPESGPVPAVAAGPAVAAQSRPAQSGAAGGLQTSATTPAVASPAATNPAATNGANLNGPNGNNPGGSGANANLNGARPGIPG